MENNQILNILQIVLILMVSILFVLVMVFVILKLKKDKESNKKAVNIGKAKTNNKLQEKKNVSNTTKTYSKQSIFDFMDFDKIEDNMIIQDNGKKCLMAIECQGVNFDLMSGMEKVSVESGFLQFLNTLRYPIQIYVQTKTVDLGESINTYRDKITQIEEQLTNKQMIYNQMLRSDDYTEKELEEARYEVVKARNLYEYGVDIIRTTERMSLNKGILSKHYYIILSYYTDELAGGNFSKDEIQNMVFSELYTRCQSVITSLSVCGINSKVLDSTGLTKLLYVAYNRDDSELYDLDKMLKLGSSEMYSVGEDILDKKMKALDNKIEEEAIRKANEALIQVQNDSEKERKIKEKERQYDELVKKMAKIVLDDNVGTIGPKKVKKAKEKIDKEDSKEEGGLSNEGTKKRRKKTV